MEISIAYHGRYYYWRRLLDNFSGAKGCHVGYSGDELSLTYHDTIVATLECSTGTLELCHGGWRTHYTKERINRFCDVLGLSVGVYQTKKRFKVEHEGTVQDWGHIDDGDDAPLWVHTGRIVSEHGSIGLEDSTPLKAAQPSCEASQLNPASESSADRGIDKQ
jgi:hypothetical protein